MDTEYSISTLALKNIVGEDPTVINWDSFTRDQYPLFKKDFIEEYKDYIRFDLIDTSSKSFSKVWKFFIDYPVDISNCTQIYTLDFWNYYKDTINHINIKDVSLDVFNSLHLVDKDIMKKLISNTNSFIYSHFYILIMIAEKSSFLLLPKADIDTYTKNLSLINMSHFLYKIDKVGDIVDISSFPFILKLKLLYMEAISFKRFFKSFVNRFV